ncbi:MAG: hypothetical protein NVSMB9_21810 [Isosphaeraceae bacterium]
MSGTEDRMKREQVFLTLSSSGVSIGVLAATVWAQGPSSPSGPPRQVVCEASGGPIRGAVQHVGRVLQDNLIGYPSEFVEPPPGFYIHQTFGVMTSKANPHRFTFYRSDFLDGTNLLSPSGSSRFNIMSRRLREWPAPIFIEWSPDQPGLAESRRDAVLALLQTNGCPLTPENVLISPSPYPGMLGTEAANNYNILIERDLRAPGSYSLTPTSGAGFGGGGNR